MNVQKRMWEGPKAWSVLETVHSPVWLEQEIGWEGRSEELGKHQVGHTGPHCPLRGLSSMLRAGLGPIRVLMSGILERTAERRMVSREKVA